MIDTDLVAFMMGATDAGDSVHTSEIPQGAPLPALVIRRIGGTDPKTLGNRRLFGRAIYMLVCVGLETREIGNIPEQIKTRLDSLPGLMGTATSVKHCRCLSGPNDISAVDGDLKLAAFAQEFSFMYRDL